MLPFCQSSGILLWSLELPLLLEVEKKGKGEVRGKLPSSCTAAVDQPPTMDSSLSLSSFQHPLNVPLGDLSP